MAKKKNKLYELFESSFQIGLFYKPTMTDTDIFYYIALDDNVRLSIRLYNDNVITIHDIIPITTKYLAKFYKKLITFLMKQELFTVLISCIGYTSGIEETCIELGIPVVDDERFLSVPSRVYQRMKTVYTSDTKKYGFYLLAVHSNITIEVNQEEEPEEPEQEILTDSGYKEEVQVVEVDTHTTEEPKEPSRTINNICDRFILFLKSDREFHEIRDVGTGIFEASFRNGIYIKFKMVEYDQIDIVEISSSLEISSIYYMMLFEKLEAFLDDESHIMLPDVQNRIVYNVCRSREYPRISNDIAKKSTYRTNQHNAFGTYQIKSLK